MTNQSEEREARAKAKTLRPLGRLLPFVRPYLTMMVIAGVALVLAAGSTLVLPIGARIVTDVGFSPERRSEIALTFVGALGLFFLLSAFSAVRYYAVSWLGERVVADLRAAVFDHLTRLPPAFFEVTRTGEVLSRLTTDTTVIQAVVGANVSIALRNSLIFSGSLVMMIVTDWRLSALLFAALPVLIVPLLIAGRLVRRLSRSAQDRIADASAQAGETIQAMTTVQAFGQEAHERARFAKANDGAFHSAVRRVRARAIMIEVVIFLVSAAIIGVLWIGALNVIEGRASAGEFIQFILYAVFTAGSLGALAEVWGELMRAAGATERLLELLASEPAIKAPPNPAALPAGPQPIAFEDVTFAYPTRPGANALETFSLQITPGETIAFVGPSGAGKSTLFRLLLRLYDPQAGRITIGGTDIRAADPVAVRARFALVAQEPVIFSGTIAENIAYGRPGASADDIAAAAAGASADGFIGRLRDGYATRLGERGITLSGGERQRVALARAILKDAPVLLLDEATASLDSEAEAEIQAALAQLKRGRTSLIIAHRLSTVIAADRIVVIDRGQIAAIGTHRQLMAENGLYARLARLQFLAEGEARPESGSQGEGRAALAGA